MNTAAKPAKLPETHYDWINALSDEAFRLRDAAVEAAKQWEFKPAEGSGAPVTMQGVVTFSFGLQ